MNMKYILKTFLPLSVIYSPTCLTLHTPPPHHHHPRLAPHLQRLEKEIWPQKVWIGLLSLEDVLDWDSVSHEEEEARP